MKTSKTGLNLIKEFESCRLKAYKDSAGVWTIGWGTIMYKSGEKVKSGDVITQAEADMLLAWQIGIKESAVDSMTAKYHLNQNQFDALMSFTYNVGIGGLAGSTLLKKVKANKEDPSIALEFEKWSKATINGKLTVVPGLLRRRKAEAALYFLPA